MPNQTGLKTLDRLGRHPGVERIYRDSDGIWVDLKNGWRNSYDEPRGALHGIHENTARDILDRVSGIVRCEFDCCKKEASDGAR